MGDASYDAASGLWTRMFGNGTEVHFDVTTNHGGIKWV